jgi:DNA processing protein
MTDATSYLVAFATVPGIGTARLTLLMNYFGQAESAWKASESELRNVGLPKDALAQLLEQKRKLNVQQYCENLNKRNIKVLTIFDEDYPERLKNIPDSPNVLFIKSQLSVKQINRLTLRKIIGVVGTRKITHYGEEITAQLTSSLVMTGFTIVSGMALGVDGVAHGTTINCGGTTIAVLGAGVEIVYPPQHNDLYNSILEHGGVILSEVAPEKLVIRGVFPARNRIISGLSEAIIVTEGAIDSGSLITARAALEQGREVFSVPGQINSPMAEGTNSLLKQGARLVTSVEDILESLGYSSNLTNLTNLNGKILPKGDTLEEQTIIDLLSAEPLEFDELVKRSDFSPAQVGSILSVMEIAGKVKNHDLLYRLS